MYCILGWKEVHFLTAISFGGSLLCRLRNMSPSHMCCIMSFIKPFSLEETQVRLPRPCGFTPHCLQNTEEILWSVKRSYCLNETTDRTFG